MFDQALVVSLLLDNFGTTIRSSRTFPKCDRLQQYKTLLPSRGENKTFPLPSPPRNVVPLFGLPIENNKQPSFESREGGRESSGIAIVLAWYQSFNLIVSVFSIAN